jgi:hypothetical protein
LNCTRSTIPRIWSSRCEVAAAMCSAEEKPGTNWNLNPVVRKL